MVELSSMTRTPQRRIRLGALAVLVAWALITLVSSASFFLDGAVLPNQTWFETFLQFGTIWMLWILIVPVIVWAARRFPLDRGRWPKALLVHAPISILWAAIYFPLTLVVLRTWSGSPLWANFGAGLKTYGFRALHEAFIYWVIAIAAYAYWNFEDRRTEQRRATELTLRNGEIREELVRSELRTLRDQLHPHFLFNTLNSIAGLIRTDDRDTALQVLARLSELLRYTLETEREERVPLRKEIEFIRQYLTIQQIRFRDRLQVDVRIEEGCGEWLVPSLILQPLVENAVHHGVVNERSDNRVELHARRERGKLTISILNTIGERTENRSGFGIGLQNVKKRLQHLYGSTFSLLSTQREDKTMEVVLSIPARTTAPGDSVRISTAEEALS